MADDPSGGGQGKGLIESIGYQLQPDAGATLPGGLSVASADWAFEYDLRGNVLAVAVRLLVTGGPQAPPASAMISLHAAASPADVDAIAVWMSSIKVAMTAAARKSAGGK